MRAMSRGLFGTEPDRFAAAERYIKDFDVASEYGFDGETPGPFRIVCGYTGSSVDD